MLSYLIFMLPALLLGLWAQAKVKWAYAQASQIPPASGLSGAEAASRILEAEGLRDVEIEVTHGYLGDHYDPRAKVLRLSDEVYQGRSLAALGVAAHEAGHAIQDAQGYGLMVVRNAIVPLASIGSNMSFFLIFIGGLIGAFNLILLGVFLFSAVVVFQLVNLPVEYNASARAKDILLRRGLISPEEQKTVSSVLSAAALTYVAATVSAILTLLYYLFRLGIIGGRDE